MPCWFQHFFSTHAHKFPEVAFKQKKTKKQKQMETLSKKERVKKEDGKNFFHPSYLIYVYSSNQRFLCVVEIPHPTSIYLFKVTNGNTNLFKINDKDTRTLTLNRFYTLLWCFHFLLSASEGQMIITLDLFTLSYTIKTPLPRDEEVYFDVVLQYFRCFHMYFNWCINVYLFVFTIPFLLENVS